MTRPKKEETLAKTKDVHLRMNELNMIFLQKEPRLTA